jgi:hypothetical protein
VSVAGLLAAARAADAHAWPYVIAGWGLTAAVLGGYWARLRARIRRAERTLEPGDDR